MNDASRSPPEQASLGEYVHSHPLDDALLNQSRRVERKVAIVDLDRTAFNVSERWNLCERRFGKRTDAFWDCWHSPQYVPLDKPMKGAVEFLQILNKTHYIVYLSGRIEQQRSATVKSLERFGFPKGEIILKKTEERRMRTVEYKSRELDKLMKVADITHFFDDDEKNIEIAKKAGIRFVLSKIPDLTEPLVIKKIITGGQSGADLGGAFFGKNMGILTELNVETNYKPLFDPVPTADPPFFKINVVTEKTAPAGWGIRRKYNVAFSDATIIFVRRPIENTRGSRATLADAKKIGRPVLVFNVGKDEPFKLLVFLRAKRPVELNIAGERDIAKRDVMRILETAIGPEGVVKPLPVPRRAEVSKEKPARRPLAVKREEPLPRPGIIDPAPPHKSELLQRTPWHKRRGLKHRLKYRRRRNAPVLRCVRDKADFESICKFHSVKSDPNWVFKWDKMFLRDAYRNNMYVFTCGSQYPFDGLMVVQTARTYLNILYLETAPWNRRKKLVEGKEVDAVPAVEGTGSAMIYAAIELSKIRKRKGAIKLVSAEQATGFYRRIEMREVGTFGNQVMFAFSPDEARNFQRQHRLALALARSST